MAVTKMSLRDEALQKHADSPRASSTRLAELVKRYGLSLRELSNLCGGSAKGASKTTVARLLRGDVTDEALARLKPLVVKGLRKFLEERKTPAKKIDAELEGLLDRVVPAFSLTDEEARRLDTWGKRLEAFRLHYKLSYDTLTNICGGHEAWVSRTSLQRHATGGSIEPRNARRCIPYIIAGLRRFLERRGREAEQIDAELRVIFPEGGIAVIAQRTTLSAEVQRHFGLRFDPFDPTRAPRSGKDVFTTPQLDRVAARIEDAINYQGFVVVTGEIGSGKTIMKLRANELVRASGGKMRLLWPDFPNMDRVHSGSIVKFLLESFDQRVPLDLVTRAARLKCVLTDLAADGVRVALGFDECHRLHDHLLTALKNFWELSEGYDRFLGVVLFGQPQFEGRLRDHRFREIVERVDIVRMPPFGKAAWEYVAHRVRLAGGNAEKIFEREAIATLVEQLTRDATPTPQAIGNLANAALIKAHALNERKVLADFIGSDDGEPRVRAMRRAG